jgi:3-phenylpropionate/trans-cinnamate dioxygenase ferredoxin subunit
MNKWVTVAPVEALAPGQPRVVDVDDTQVAVFNLEGYYYAIEDVCTHDGGKLTGGNVEADQIVCPRRYMRQPVRMEMA